MSKKERMKELFLNIQNLEGRDFLKGHLVYYAGPTIVGVKPATIMTLSDGKDLRQLWAEYGSSLCQEYGVKWKTLKVKNNKETIILYHPISLEMALKREDHSTFLAQFGYKQQETLEMKIKRLSSRFESLCPHEMGIFLGFPLEEVKAYMECPGRQCLMCGYWKVYSNVNIAKKAFKLFDEIRFRMLQAIVEPA